MATVRVAEACEFPNDNPKLHRGAVWLCRTPCAPPRPVVRPTANPVRSVESAPRHAPAAAESSVAGPRQNEPQKTAGGDYDHLLKVMQDILLEAGAVRIAGVLPNLFESSPIEPTLLDTQTTDRLLSNDILEQRDGRLRTTPAFQAAALSWRSILNGHDSDQFDECVATLDEWATELLAACLEGGEKERARLRKHLRKSGIFAFGVRVQSA